MKENNIKYSLIGVTGTLLIYNIYLLIKNIINIIKYQRNMYEILNLFNTISIIVMFILIIINAYKGNIEKVNKTTIIYLSFTLAFYIFFILNYNNAIINSRFTFSLTKNLIICILSIVIVNLNYKEKMNFKTTMITLIVVYSIITIADFIFYKYFNLIFLLIEVLNCSFLILVCMFKDNSGVSINENCNKYDFEKDLEYANNYKIDTDTNTKLNPMENKSEDLINKKNINNNGSLYEKLKQLKMMYDDGLISSLEYSDKKEKILKNLTDKDA